LKTNIKGLSYKKAALFFAAARPLRPQGGKGLSEYEIALTVLAVFTALQPKKS